MRARSPMEADQSQRSPVQEWRVDGSRVLLSAYSLDCLVSPVGMACNGQSEPRSHAGVVAGVLFDYLGFPWTASMHTVAPRGVRALFCR